MDYVLVHMDCLAVHPSNDPSTGGMAHRASLIGWIERMDEQHRPAAFSDRHDGPIASPRRPHRVYLSA